MAQSNLPLTTFLHAIYLIMTHRKRVPSTMIARELGVTQKTAWHLAHRIRKALEMPGGLFSGPVEIDETYIGGKEENKHSKKKLKVGRGTVGKTAVAGARDREDGKVKARPVEGTDKGHLQGLVKEAVQEGATVFTDEHKAYVGLDGYSHETVSSIALVST